jgi:hypothetical protein
MHDGAWVGACPGGVSLQKPPVPQLEQFLYPLRVVPAFLGFFGVVVRLSAPRLGEPRSARPGSPLGGAS